MFHHSEVGSKQRKNEVEVKGEIDSGKSVSSSRSNVDLITVTEGAGNQGYVGW